MQYRTYPGAEFVFNDWAVRIAQVLVHELLSFTPTDPSASPLTLQVIAIVTPYRGEMRALSAQQTAERDQAVPIEGEFGTTAISSESS